MSRFTSSNDGLRSLCAELGDDDTQAPDSPGKSKSLVRGSSERRLPASARASGRKAHQLCRQVGQTLDEVLAECADQILQNLRVEAVEPFPDASHLLVTVAFIDDRPGTISDVALVLDHLHRASGHLRSEIVTAITRKRAPLLHYRVAWPSGG